MGNREQKPSVVIVGTGPRAAGAALELARDGADVRIVSHREGLMPGDGGPLDAPTLLSAAAHRGVDVIAGAAITEITRNGRLLAKVEQAPRFVDPAVCTACGRCAEACPVTITEASGDTHPAIHRGGVPTSYAIDKLGTAPCRDACPIHQRAQGYTALVRAGAFEEAYKTIALDNPFPSVCGRVCNRRCEESCSRAKVDEPVNVMALKRFVADWAMDHGIGAAAFAPPRPPDSGKRVAVVGAGPAGLACARALVRRGHAVTVYEALSVPGGMMMTGVPEYRLPGDRVRPEIEAILAEGVDLRLNSPVDDAPALLEAGHDAVFVAVGAHRGIKLPIPGADLPDVHIATDFLRDAKLSVQPGDDITADAPVDVHDKRVLVLGGGNVAVDAAMTAVRLGAAWVGMSCLEGRDTMPAHDWEIRDARDEGIDVFPSRTFKEVTDDEGRVTGVRCVEVDFRGFVDGRPDFDELPGTEEVIAADLVIFAIGQVPDASCLGDEVEVARGRFAVVDPDTQATSLSGVFAGGDLVTGTAFIVDAIAAGHRAAEAIDHFVRGEDMAVTVAGGRLPAVTLTREDVEARLATGIASDSARSEPTKRSPEERVHDFCEVCVGLSAEEARTEAARCLSCGFCSECLLCADVCPAGAIDHSRQPQSLRLTADTVIWAEPPPSIGSDDALPGTGLPDVVDARDDGVLPRAVARARIELGLAPSTAPAPTVAAPSRWLSKTRPGRIGVFLCRCGGEIGRTVDLDAVAARVAELPHVTHVSELDFACQPAGADELTDRYREAGLDGAVLAACSCCALDQVCYSCTSQRMRCKEQLGVFAGLDALPVEFVNVREQCAFVHGDDPAAATAKAGDLASAAVGAMLAATPASIGSNGQGGPTPITLAGAAASATDVAAAPIGSARTTASHRAITAVVDPVRCRGCEDCETACGLDAIHVTGSNGDRRAVVEADRCLGCGICLAACASGAIQASDVSDAQAEARLASMGDLSGREIVFTCNWGAYSAIEAAGADHRTYDANVRAVRLMCAGRVHPGLVLRAFQRGAERVTVLTCGHDTEDASLCRYETGNLRAHDAVRLAREMIALLGIDPSRLRSAEMQPGRSGLFLAALGGGDAGSRDRAAAPSGPSGREVTP